MLKIFKTFACGTCFDLCFIFALSCVGPNPITIVIASALLRVGFDAGMASKVDLNIVDR